MAHPTILRSWRHFLSQLKLSIRRLVRIRVPLKLKNRSLCLKASIQNYHLGNQTLFKNPELTKSELLELMQSGAYLRGRPQPQGRSNRDLNMFQPWGRTRFLARSILEFIMTRIFLVKVVNSWTEKKKYVNASRTQS